MHTKEKLVRDMKKMGIESTDTLMVHSSMKAIGDVEGGADAVLDALIEVVKDGLLLLPTHTWSTVIESQPYYNPKTEPACVGILPNLFLKREAVVRSLHPTHSVAAYGKRAAEYTAGEENTQTPCPRNGCWGRLYDEKAKILFLGASLKTNTYIHSIEEWNSIPSRLARRKSTMFIVLPTGGELKISMRRHDHPSLDVSKQYDKVEELLMDSKACKTGKIGDANCYLLDAVKTGDEITALLKNDPDVFARV
jgi:aminoglycoside 3-N-acetyltransferase